MGMIGKNDGGTEERRDKDGADKIVDGIVGCLQHLAQPQGDNNETDGPEEPCTSVGSTVESFQCPSLDKRKGHAHGGAKKEVDCQKCPKIGQCGIKEHNSKAHECQSAQKCSIVEFQMPKKKKWCKKAHQW